MVMHVNGIFLYLLPVFHHWRIFTKHCKKYYSDEFAFDNCCEEYKLHSEDEKVKREEYFKFCEDLSTYGIYFSSTFQQRDDQRHMHAVVNDSYEEYAAIGDTSHCDQDINDLQNVNHNIDAFDLVPTASTDLGCQED